MNKYEIMFIVKATIDKEAITATAEAMKKIITDDKGKVVEFKEIGEKKFAYPIKKELNGYYFLMQVEANSETESEFNRKASLDENVLRHLIIKLDEE
jgi:small subunit ribosomal protein S6